MCNTRQINGLTEKFSNSHAVLEASCFPKTYLHLKCSQKLDIHLHTKFSKNKLHLSVTT